MSRAGIEHARNIAKHNDINLCAAPNFFQCDLSTLGTSRKEINSKFFQTVTTYSRLFQHAIDEDVENTIFLSIKKMSQKHIQLYFKFRNTNDVFTVKKHGNHYRIYIEHSVFLIKVLDLGFDLGDESDGRGYAYH
ncbi:hypothetical protein OAR11_00250 [Alphaproteobacteria bacterium]|nr:hypothetical protein [Alphaproteobacteria bacterium]